MGPSGALLAPMDANRAGYLKAVWPDLFGVHFGSLAGPGGPGKAFQKVEGVAPHIFEGLPGVPGAGKTSERHPQNSGQSAFKYPDQGCGYAPPPGAA